jgi:beta-galactosidase
MKKIGLFLLFLIKILFISVEMEAQNSNVNYTINENWRFFKGDTISSKNDKESKKNYELVSLPHTWNNEDAVDQAPGFYRGIGWYCRNIFIGDEGKNKQVYIHFEGANQELELYINGKKVGNHIGGYTAFNFDITAFVVVGKQNSFAIKLTNEYNKDIPPLSADFTFFGGIYRNVSLQFLNPIHFNKKDFASSGVFVDTQNVTEKNATIIIKSIIKNNFYVKKSITIQTNIIAPSGIVVSSSKDKINVNPNITKEIISKPISIIDPALWSIENPNRYKVQVSLIENNSKQVQDLIESTFGIRWFNFTANEGFILNGKQVKLIGTNRHECYEGMGNALRDEMQLRDIRLIKEMGGNFLRLAHYPQNQEIVNLCDQLGIVTILEVPIVNAITESDAFLNNSLQMVNEMVKQNYNHPSIVAWSYMNEIMLRLPYKNDPEKHKNYCIEVHKQAIAIENLIRQLDSNRFTIIPCHGSLNAYKESNIIDVPKVIGWNLYQGWYSSNFNGFDDFIDNFHKEFPNKPIVITEYGADVDVRLHSFLPERFDYTSEYANLYHEHYLKSILDRKFISGAMIWNLNDFYSEYRENAVPHINNKGITGLDREIKNTYLLYQANLLKTPFIAIGDKNWISRAGVETAPNSCLQPVIIYSNQPEIELFHNGISLGKYSVENGVTSAKVPFVNGENTIETIASKDNKLKDFLKIKFDLIPSKSNKTNYLDLNVMLGSNRYFEDRTSQICWIPEQAYTTGSWGYIGGEAFKPKTKNGIIPSSDLDIYNTNQDPIFQTQRLGINEFKADVPEGKYLIYCYWANLSPKIAKENLVYTLGNTGNYTETKTCAFDVFINNQIALKDFDICNQIGVQQAVIKKMEATVTDGKGIDIKLQPINGSVPFLNAIRIVKLF